MLYAKIENDKIVYKSSASRLEYNESIIINPIEEDFFNAGYEILPTSEKPLEEDGASYYAKYQIVNGTIAQVWIKREVLDEPI